MEASQSPTRSSTNSTRIPMPGKKKRTRTRTGCLNCRRKRRKCDEDRPSCGTCRRRSERCEWGLRLTFRDENVQVIQDTHPSMRIARRRRPKEFEILDVTDEVIRECNLPSPVIDFDDDDDHDESTTHPNNLDNRREGTFSSHSATVDDTSSSSHQQPSTITTSLAYGSQDGQPQTPPTDPALQLPFHTLPIDMTMDFSCLDQMQAFTPEGAEDGIFLPGTAYHELHSTLRDHLIQEVRSNAPTQPASPCLDADSDSEESAPGDIVVETVPLADVPSSRYTPSSLLSEEVECRLWENWFDEIAPWLDKFDSKQHFRNVLPTHARNCNYLRYSMLATSSRQLELKENTRPTDQSLTLYQEAIHQLLPHLSTRSTNVIATCVILCVLEMMSCSPKAWKRHLDGCASLMEAVGINGSIGGVEQALFWCFARMDVCGGLISSVKTLIPISHWVSGPIEAERLFSSAIDFEQWANYAVYLIASVLHLLASAPGETSQSFTTYNDPKFVTNWLKLWKNLCDWHLHRPAPLLPIMTAPSSETSPFPTILFSNPAAISGTQLYHTASILMLQNQSSAVRRRLSPKPRSILWHARQVCGISISNKHHGAWTNGIQPLWIAGRCMSHPSEHKAILDLLERIERESGWSTKWRADDLKEYWGDLGD